MEPFARRRELLAQSLPQQEVEAILVSDPINIRYLTGFTGSSAICLVTARQSILISDARYEVQISTEVAGVEVVIRPMTQKLPDAAAMALGALGVTTVALEADHATLALREVLSEGQPAINWHGVRGAVQSLRVVKDATEIAQIQEAVRIAERAFGIVLAQLNEAQTEKELADLIDYQLRVAGAKGSAFAPIVAAGARAALPHASPSRQSVGTGGLLLIDWGANLGYHSDLTRTFRTPFATPAGPHEFEAIFDAVEAAHEAAVALLRDGVAAKEVDAAARAVLSQVPLAGGAGGSLADQFTHGLGHGLGLEVHESPDLRSSSSDVLKAGMVVTIEPGVYLPGWGGVRLEDDYLVTETGAERLSTLPREPRFIG